MARAGARATQVIAILLSGAALPAFAQPSVPPELPNRTLLTREEITPPPAPAAADRSRLKVEGGEIERAPCPLADPSYANIRVTITGATFNNLGPVPAEALRPAYEPYLGSDRPVSAICDIRDAAATLLRRRGYLAAIQVPTQKIENGQVVFEVLYARLAAVRVRGAAGRAEKLIASYLTKLTRDPVFNRFAAERYLLLARDLPGYDVRLALRPTGAAPGELIGDVTVSRTPIDADVNVQNYAARDTGRFGGQLRAQFYGLTGLGDRTSVALYSTADFKEQQILQLGHDMRLGGEGLTLGGRFTYAWTRPDIDGAGRIVAHTLFANGEISYPILRSQRANLRGAFGFDYINQDVRVVGLKVARDRVRVAYIRADGDMVDLSEAAQPRWRLGYSAELRQGIDVFGASEGVRAGRVNPSRRDGDATSTVIRGQASLDLALVPNVTFTLSPRGQFSFDPLLSFEEFSGGTYTIGRGYDPGTIIGDSGAGIAAEARLNRVTPFGPSVALQPFAFVDSAWVWNRNRPGDPERLTSVGGGVRTSIASRFRLDATLAVPVKKAGLLDRRGDVRLLVSLTTKLLPWGGR